MSLTNPIIIAATATMATAATMATTAAIKSLVDIKQYTIKFEGYPPELQEFCAGNKVKLPGIDTLRGQAYALMAQPENRGQKFVGRTEATDFFKQIGLATDDAIQPFNKTIGLKRMKGKGTYCLVYPFESDMTDIDKRKGCAIGGDRNTAIDTIKQWWRENLVDVPNEEWQIGHLDPNIADATEKNLAYQPPIQAKYRNRFKWCSYFQRMWPTGDEVSKNLDEYYNETEQRLLLETLKNKFEKK